ncbi:hypothetical protein AAG906_029200 [Vitis piasezkii]
MTFGHNSWRYIVERKNFPTFEVRQIHQKSQDGYEKWYVENQKMKRWLLMSISPKIMKLRGEILCKDHLPDLEECYALIRREAQDQSNTNHPKTDPNINKSTFKCTHCNKIGHTKSRCFEIVGYPDWWDHNRDQRKKDSKKTSTAAVVEIKTEANVAKKASTLVAATDYGDRSHPLDFPHKKLFPQPMVIQPQSLGKDP